ncbi:MAG: nitroreductase family protein [Kiritimatiellae bacterium]|nr:nitroreductase family protein [Kiritimatiellia bacterium]
MDAIEALLTRRSIRRFHPDPVRPHDVERLLEVLFRSPSAGDARPWQFGVVDRRDLLDRLAGAMPKCEMLSQAPLAVLICAEPAREKIPGFWPQDCAAATENLLIAAHALGYGAVWIGLHPVADRERAVREILRIPATLVPFALVPIGRAAETPPPDERRDPNRIHRNEW